ncbi:MAG: hypothetical protein EPN36_05190 [Rhodanobacteraceae bacterium]|nr:MAG: hypothetical protein EPN36_05190 [Rhodanobacteraceae bacterium]
MRADPRFQGKSKEFWAHVRTISQEVGYTRRGTKEILVPSIPEIAAAFERLGLSRDHVIAGGGRLTAFGASLADYFSFRASVLNDQVRDDLMDKDEARSLFKKLRGKRQAHCPLPMKIVSHRVV